MTEPPREPFFGQNAKPWLIQLAVGLVLIIVVVPFIKPYIGHVTDPIVMSAFDSICSTTGWCTQEAAARSLASEHQQ